MNFRVVRFFTTLFLILLLGTVSPLSGAAQGNYRANIEFIENGQFPILEAYVSVTDVQGFPVKDLTNSDFTVSEDGSPVANFEISPAQNTKQTLAVALVIDTSGSMGTRPIPTALMNAVEAAKTFVDSLSDQDLVAVVRFSDAPEVAQDFTADKNVVKASLDSLTAGGETTMYDGIVKAVGLLKERSERRILVLLTDGRDTGDGQFDFKGAMDEASRWGVPIYPIGFGEADRKELEQMAALSGGFAQIQPDSAELSAAFSAVLQALREQYLLRYTSSLAADAAEHTLHVAVAAQGFQVEAERKFIALPRQITITLPFENEQAVGGTVLLKPKILSPAPMAKLEIQLDGNLLQTVMAEPFEYAWNSTTVSPGLHNFKFTATDKAGNTASASIRLKVQPPVTVTITAPKTGQSLNGNVKIKTDVQSLAGVAKVEFSLDGKVLQTVTAPPFEATLDFSKVSAGPHNLSVRVVDVNGFEATAKQTVSAQGTAWGILFLILAVAAAAIVIPIGLRSRRKKVVAAAPTRIASLRELEGLSPGSVWPLEKQEVRLGRKRGENDILLAGLSASRYHAVIRYEQGSHVIYSMASNNPVNVNDSPVAQKRALLLGDTIRMGETVFRYEQ